MAWLWLSERASRAKAAIAARLGPAYLGLAWPGLWPEAGPCTALVAISWLGFFESYLGIAMGNPGVYPGYPYPYPSLPVPGPWGMGLAGTGHGFFSMCH